MFCPNCGMLKSNCICSHNNVENENSSNSFQSSAFFLI